ncbi:hypothetical protein vseg_010386 [Gypsophila vaccaria]
MASKVLNTDAHMIIENEPVVKQDNELELSSLESQLTSPVTNAITAPADKTLQLQLASKVPKFDAWEGGENFVNNARVTKTGGQKINPNEAEKISDFFQLDRYSAQEQQRKQTKVPHLSDLGDRTKGGRPKVPQFGDWESESGDGYTAAFDLPKKGRDRPKPNAPQSNHDVSPTLQEGLPKVPKSGNWQGGEGEQYTTYSEKLAKNSKNSRPVGYPDVGASGAGPRAASSLSGSEQQSRPSAAKVLYHPGVEVQLFSGKLKCRRAAFGGEDISTPFDNEQRQMGRGELLNHGRVPLIRDFVDGDSARHPLSVDEAHYGGGTRTTYDHTSNASQGHRVSTPSPILSNQGTHRSKVPKFGAWEGGENFIDNAPETKTGGQKIDPNDPGEHTAADSEFQTLMRRGELLNHGRAPLIGDFVADSARRLPSVDEVHYGGGTRTTCNQTRVEGPTQMGTASQVHGVSTPDQVPLPTLPNQKTRQVNRSISGTKKGRRGRCLLPWF